ncbi:MAG TPA: tetratricopeptide repeat protein [Candidatus Polarisedimenticolia bacterium]|jgi:tetratricopeptide (TPR) repeat protein|nr:tetratricopeptide repeat protein [Candidatus Polarisedimenticolia bacterium]
MKRSSWIPAAAVALTVVALHLRTLGFEFVFDDLHLIVNNSFLHEPWSPLTAFAHHFWHGTPFGAAYYRPIATSSLALNGRLFGWGPAGFHLVNLLLHAANAALLLELIRRIGAPVWAATCAAALFAVHPVAAWPVGSIVARVDLLPAFFVLLAWLALHDGRRPVLVGLLFLMALLSKESAAAFLAVPILGLRRLRDPEPLQEVRTPDRRDRTWPALLALGGSVVAWLALRLWSGVGVLIAQKLVDPLTNPLGQLTMPSRLWAALALAGRYILYLVVPVRFSDPRNYVDPSTLPSPWAPSVLLSLGALSAWGAGILILWLRRDRIALPLAFSLASFLPASNILMPISSLYAQNFLYMPLLGLCLALGDLLGRLAARRTSVLRAAPLLVATPILAVLAMVSYTETGLWRDGVSLFTAWTERFPNYSMAHSSLGVMLIGRGVAGEAVPSFRRALAITERNAEAHYNLGVALMLTRQDKATREDALTHLRRASELAPFFAPAHVDAAKALLLLDRPVEAEAEARAALHLAPGFTPALLDLADALYGQARYAEAADAYGDLVSLDPDDVDARSNYVVALIRSGQTDRARAATDAARSAFPRLAWFDFCLARVEAQAGRKGEALVLLETALARDPKVKEWLEKVDEFDVYAGTREFQSVLSRSGPR